MKPKIQLVGLSLALVLVSTVMTSRVSAQHAYVEHDKASWKKGMLRLSKPAWAGDVRLKSGMYHVRHMIDGNMHVLVFKSVAIPGGKGFLMWEEKEVARMECRVESAIKSVSNTKVVFSKTNAGERTIHEIQIAGERFRHILLPPASANRSQTKHAVDLLSKRSLS